MEVIRIKQKSFKNEQGDIIAYAEVNLVCPTGLLPLRVGYDGNKKPFNDVVKGLGFAVGKVDQEPENRTIQLNFGGDN